MNNNNLLKSFSTVKIGVFENTRQMCRVLSHKGTIEILYALQERTKQYKELDAELQLPSPEF